ncbi:MAG TPA: hypothetical protein VI251_05170 [Pseudolabrys sp.]|jgi:hypothetical protein
MCAFTVAFDRTEIGYSPDRVNALVWALTELMVEGEGRHRLLFACSPWSTRYRLRWRLINEDSHTGKLWNAGGGGPSRILAELKNEHFV